MYPFQSNSERPACLPARPPCQVEAVKSAARQRGSRLVVAVVQSAGEGELPDDRVAMICRQAGIDKK